MSQLHIRGVCHFFQNWLPWQRLFRYWKKGPDRSSAPKTLSFGEKTAKIGPVDTEIIFFDRSFKNKEINASKIYSPLGILADQAKLIESHTKPLACCISGRYIVEYCIMGNNNNINLVV